MSLLRPVKSLALVAGLFAFWASTTTWNSAFASDDCTPLKIDQRVKIDVVYDGSTFLVGDTVVMLTGVHVPIAARHLRAPQPLGKAVAQAVGELVRRSKGQLNLEYDQLSSQNGRVLAHAYLGDGRNLALTLLENGFALVNTQLPNSLHAQCYRQAESRARAAKLGLWQFQDMGVPVVESKALTGERRGFQIVRGTIVNAEQKARYFSLTMDTVSLRIPNESLKWFDVKALLALKGKTVEIRDEFTFYRNHMVASLEHPGQIDLLADTFYDGLANAKSKR